MLSYLPPSLPAWLGTGGALGVGFAITRWFLEYVAARLDKRADRLDADTRFVIESLRAEVDRLNEWRAEAQQEMRDLRQQLSECRERHTEARAELMLMKAQQQGYGEARDRAQTIIAAERVQDRKAQGVG